MSNTPNQPEHPSQAEGDRDDGLPGAETAQPAQEGSSDPAHERPSQAEGDETADQ